MMARRYERAYFLMIGGFSAFFVLAMAWMVAAEQQNPAVANDRVLSLGGDVTEIVYALGEGHRLLGRDSTSTYPPQALDLPDVGYVRALSPEGVLSVGPSMILAADGAGPPEAIDVLKSTSIEFVTIPTGYDGETIADKIRTVGEALGIAEKGDALADQVLSDLADAQAVAAASDGADKRVLFVLSTQGGRIMASGTNTAANGIIQLAGATNAIQSFEGYKQMSDEAVIAAAPDVILMMDRGGNHGVSNADLLALPAIASTPAARREAIVRLNGLLLLGFGPRTPEAVRALSDALAKG